MKIAILVPLLLSSTAFAGYGRLKRQSTLCRPGNTADCPSGQTCQYVTRNPDGSGFDGACLAEQSSSSSSASSSSISPSPSVVICRDDSNCGSGQRCQFVTRNPDGSGFDGACVAGTTPSSSVSSSSSSSSASSVPSTVVCKDDSNCGSGQRCQFVTRNPDESGFDGACVAASGTSSSSSMTPSASYVICRDASNCASGQRCQFATRNPDGSGFDGYCVSETSSSSSAPSASASGGGGCRVSSDCIATQYCNYNTGGAQKCTNYPDCRFMGCPGGQCVSEQPNVKDPRDINNAFVCQSSGSSSAPSSSISASSTSSSSSSAASSTPTTKICRLDDDCSATQYCRYVTRNADESGYDGACTELSDCRGPNGCGSDNAGYLCQAASYYPGLYYKDPGASFTCVRSDCRIAGCSEDLTCALNVNLRAYSCLPKNVTCEVTGCQNNATCTPSYGPGGVTYSCATPEKECSTFGCPVGERCEIQNGTLPLTTKCVADDKAKDCRTTGCTDGGGCELAAPYGAIGGYQCKYQNKGFDCRVDGCEDFDTCAYYSKGELTGYLCLDKSSLSDATDCRVGGCPGGTCGFNGNFFQCFCNTSPSSSSSASGSASKSTGPTSSSHPTSSSAHPSGKPEPSPSPSPAPAPGPGPTPGPAPGPSPTPGPEPHPSSSSSPTPAPHPSPAPEPSPAPGPVDCTVDNAKILEILYEIKKDVKEIKAKLEL